jgi:uncharacterized Zn finger protein
MEGDQVGLLASIHSMMDLLRGKLSNAVMQRLTQPEIGMFPEPKEIDFKCSCPDSAYLCKHLAAVMYGIGNRLDASPELLFVLRGVEQSELIGEIAVGATESDTFAGQRSSAENGLADDDLGSLFGIDLVTHSPKPKKRPPKKTSTKQVKAVASQAKAIEEKPTKRGRPRRPELKPAASPPAVSEAHVSKRTSSPKRKPALPDSLRVVMEKLERSSGSKPR